MSKQVFLLGQNSDEFIAAIRDAVVPALTENLSKQFQPKEPIEYLTRSEVCKLLKIDLSTLHRWRKDGHISSYGFGNRIYFKRSEIDCLINKNQLS